MTNSKTNSLTNSFIKLIAYMLLAKINKEVMQSKRVEWEKKSPVF